MSLRTGNGSIGTKGYSLRSGIPGLSYRRSWGSKKGGNDAIIFAVVAAVLALAVLVIRVLLVLLPIIFQGLVWICLTTYDFVVYQRDSIRKWWLSRKRMPNHRIQPTVAGGENPYSRGCDLPPENWAI